MGKRIDLTGQRFGFWVVAQQAGKNKNGQTQWSCLCECGLTKVVTTNSLRTGNSTSCGCNHAPNLINEKFGQLTIVELQNTSDKSRRYWKCQCECGKFLTLSTYQLRCGLTTSCGCKTEHNQTS